MQIELIQADPEQRPIIENLYQYYAYESSDWESEEVEIDGRFYLHAEHMDRYWQSPNWSAWLVLADGFIAGFLLIEQSEIPGLDALEFADFFILKKYRRQGIGLAIASQVLNDGNRWLLRHYKQDPQAQGFCQALLQKLNCPAQSVSPDQEHDLVSYLINPAIH